MRIISAGGKTVNEKCVDCPKVWKKQVAKKIVKSLEESLTFYPAFFTINAGRINRGGVGLKKGWMAFLVLLCQLLSLVAGAESAQEALVVSYWGDAAVAEVTLNAAERFMVGAKNVTLQTHAFEERADYVDWLAGAWDTGTVVDVVELDMEMLRTLGQNEQGAARLADLETYSKQLDLGQFSYLGLVNGTVEGRLCAVPVSMTSHLLFWNTTALNDLGMKAAPTNMEELITLAASLRSAGGGYPLAADAESRIALMVTYLQSLYGQPWIDTKTGRVSFSVEQVAQGMRYLNSFESAGVWPKLSEQGDILEGFGKGKYLGCWAWDTQVLALSAALPDGSKLEAATELSEWAPYNGGFQKALRMFAIPENAKNPNLGAKLIEYLLNSEKGARILADSRGTPISTAGFTVCQRYRLLDKVRSKANKAALSWARYPMPLGFEAPMLVEEGGVYEQVLQWLSEGIMSEEAAAAGLLSGVKVAMLY